MIRGKVEGTKIEKIAAVSVVCPALMFFLSRALGTVYAAAVLVVVLLRHWLEIDVFAFPRGCVERKSADVQVQMPRIFRMISYECTRYDMFVSRFRVVFPLSPARPFRGMDGKRCNHATQPR